MKSAGVFKTKGQHLLLILQLKVKQLTRHVIVLDHESPHLVEWIIVGANICGSKVTSPVNEAWMLGMTFAFAEFLVIFLSRSKLFKAPLIFLSGKREMATDMSRGVLAHNRVKHQSQSYQKEAKVGSEVEARVILLEGCLNLEGSEGELSNIWEPSPQLLFANINACLRCTRTTRGDRDRNMRNVRLPNSWKSRLRAPSRGRKGHRWSSVT